MSPYAQQPQWAIERVAEAATPNSEQPTFYAGYWLSAEEPALTSNPQRVPTWSSRDAAQLVADSLPVGGPLRWKTVVLLARESQSSDVLTDEESLRFMSNACARAARTAQSISDKMYGHGNYSGQFFEADAEELRRSSAVLAAMSGVALFGREDVFENRVAEMSIEDLRRRVLAQAGHLRAYASALDGLNIPYGLEGRREPKDLKSAWLAAQEGVRMPSSLPLPHLISLCLTMAPSYVILGEEGRKLVRQNVQNWYDQIRAELRKKEWDGTVHELARDPSIDCPF